MTPKLKVFYCRNTMPNLVAADLLGTRLDEFLHHGWICRSAFFDKEQASVWIEPKPREAIKRRPIGRS
jgi:hypothetical protein